MASSSERLFVESVRGFVRMVDSSERPVEASEIEEGERTPDRREAYPRPQGGRETAGKLPTDDEADPPEIIEAVGQFGIYLGVASLGLTAFGVPAMYVGFQPYGNVAVTLAVAGVTVAMILGMVYQAYVGDYEFGRRGVR